MEKALEILEGTLDALNNLLDHCEELQMNKESTLEEIEEVKEAIRELEDLKSRSCDSCLYLKITKYRGYETATCTNEKCDEMFDCDVGENFYCNKWEKK